MSSPIDNQNNFPLKKDPLTGVFDRKTMIEKFNNNLKKAKLSGESFFCLVVKLYGIKSINQYASYDIGDALIIEAVRKLNLTIPRESIIGMQPTMLGSTPVFCFADTEVHPTILKREA